MLKVSSSPHIRNNASTSKIMLVVCIALIPNIIAGALIFGPRALLVYAVTVLSCVVTEHVSCMIMKKETTIKDFSAVVTGLLLAAMLPVNIPLYIAIFGGIVAIGVVKMMFGGIGYNFANPAIASRIVLMVAFPAQLASYAVLPQYATSPQGGAPVEGGQFDAVASATPLGLHGVAEDPSILSLFLGTHAGSIGEVSILALLIGAAILLAFGIIDLWIPLSFIGTTVLVTSLFGDSALFNLLSGGLILGAFFMATDYTTSPITWKGKLIFGIGCGLITGIVRAAGFSVEAVAFSILFMNLLTPTIDRMTMTKPLGGIKRVN